MRQWEIRPSTKASARLPAAGGVVPSVAPASVNHGSRYRSRRRPSLSIPMIEMSDAAPLFLVDRLRSFADSAAFTKYQPSRCEHDHL
jgi:hypothetical protein